MSSDSLRIARPAPPAWLNARLSLMFFLEVAVIACYAPLLSVHMSHSLSLSAAEMSLVFAVGPIAALISPPIAGWVADRLFSAEISMALLSLLRAFALWFAATSASFEHFLLAMALVWLFASPTFVLTTAISFHHLPDARSFGTSRVWGTVSWILVLWVVSLYMGRFAGVQEQFSHTRNVFLFAAALSILIAGYSLTLPSTPPSQVSKNPFTFIEALRLLRNRNFLALIIASLLVSIVGQFNLILQALFYTDAHSGLGLDLASANRAGSVQQILEIGLFPALGFLIHRLGLRRVLLIGVCAWPLRFIAYAIGQPTAFVISVQILHGINIVLGIIAMQIAVDIAAPRDIRASAQALLATASQGLGSLIGQLLCGGVLSRFAMPGGGHNWRAIYLVPLVISAIAAVVLLAFFREISAGQKSHSAN